VYQNMHLHLCFFIAGGAEEVNRSQLSLFLLVLEVESVNLVLF
jgi:hypothetical protein